MDGIEWRGAPPHSDRGVSLLGVHISTPFWKERCVFVTGATGFLGGWLLKELVRQGAQVVALVRGDVRPEGPFEDLPVTVVPGSLADPELLRRSFCDFSVDTVFHLAAQPLVKVAQLDPVGTLETNVRGAWNLLEAARHSPVRRVVVTSSDKAYGSSSCLPYTEEHPLAGEFPYDVSKSCADLIAHMYARTYGMAVAITRCANLFGGGDLNFSRMIPGVVHSTWNHEPFVIRSDGRFVRDFLYVEDAAAAHLLLAEKLAENPALAGNAYNFSLEMRATILEIAARVVQMMKPAGLPPVVRNEASSEVREQFMLCDKARRELGWTPRFTFDEGMEKTIAWYSDYFARQDCGHAEPGAHLQKLETHSFAPEEYAQPATNRLSGRSAV